MCAVLYMWSTIHAALWEMQNTLTVAHTCNCTHTCSWTLATAHTCSWTHLQLRTLATEHSCSCTHLQVHAHAAEHFQLHTHAAEHIFAAATQSYRPRSRGVPAPSWQPHVRGAAPACATGAARVQTPRHSSHGAELVRLESITRTWGESDGDCWRSQQNRTCCTAYLLGLPVPVRRCCTCTAVHPEKSSSSYIEIFLT